MTDIYADYAGGVTDIYAGNAGGVTDIYAGYEGGVTELYAGYVGVTDKRNAQNKIKMHSIKMHSVLIFLFIFSKQENEKRMLRWSDSTTFQA